MELEAGVVEFVVEYGAACAAMDGVLYSSELCEVVY